MGIALNTAGVKVGYAVETSAGTMPTTGITKIPDVKEVPEMNPEPSTLDSTTLEETEYKNYIAGLKDLGGALAFNANFTNELQTAWGELVEAYETAKAAGKATWFYVVHPDLTKSVAFKGQPSKMGLPTMAVDSVLETKLYVAPNSAPEWVAKPTFAE